MSDLDSKYLEEEAAKLRSLLGDLDDLPDAIQSEIEQAPLLEKELADINAEVIRETKIGQQVEQNHSQLEEEVNKLRQRHAEVSQKEDIWRRELAEAIHTREELNAKIAEAQERLQREISKNDELESKCQALAEQTTMFTELLGPAPEELASLRQQLEEFEANIEDCAEFETKLRSRIQGHQELLNHYQAAFDSVGVNLEEDLDEASIEKVQASLAAEKQAVEGQLAQKSQEHAALVASIEALEARDGKIIDQHNLGVVKQEALDLQERLRAKQEEVSQAHELIAVLEETQRLEQALAQQDQLLSGAQAEKEQILSALKALSDLSSSGNPDALRMRNSQLLQQLKQKQQDVSAAASFDHLQEAVLNTLDMLQSSISSSIDLANQEKILSASTPSSSSSSPTSSSHHPPTVVPPPHRSSVCLIL